MKRLTTLLLSLVFTLVFALPALAAHSWQIRMSDPSTTDQLRTFNIEYVALSTLSTDQITVKLLQNGSEIESQTTQAGGDSGIFTVTVPADGSYTYQADAASSEDASTQSTDAKIVTVTTPEGSDSSDIEVTDVPGQGGTGPAVPADDGEVAASGDQGGQIGEDGAATEQGDQQEEGSSEESFIERNQWPLTILALVAIFAAGYYWFYYRQDKTIFSRDN